MLVLYLVLSGCPSAYSPRKDCGWYLAEVRFRVRAEIMDVFEDQALDSAHSIQIQDCVRLYPLLAPQGSVVTGTQKSHLLHCPCGIRTRASELVDRGQAESSTFPSAGWQLRLTAWPLCKPEARLSSVVGHRVGRVGLRLSPQQAEANTSFF